MHRLLKMCLLAMFVLTLSLPTLSLVAFADEPTNEQEEVQQGAGEEVGLYSTVGLLAVGGAGSLIIAHNSKKKKNVPSDEIKAEQSDE